jgi:hypothetical protein
MFVPGTAHGEDTVLYHAHEPPFYVLRFATLVCTRQQSDGELISQLVDAQGDTLYLPAITVHPASAAPPVDGCHLCVWGERARYATWGPLSPLGRWWELGPRPS